MIRGQDTVLFRQVVLHGEAFALLAHHDHLVVGDILPQVLEAHLGDVYRAVIPGGDPVQQVGGGHAAGHAPVPAPGLDEIIEEQAQDGIGIPIHPGGVHNPEAVGVGVHRQAQVRPGGLDAGREILEKFLGRLRPVPAEVGVPVAVEEFHLHPGLL